MAKDRLFGIAVMATLIGLGATAVEVSVPDSPVQSTSGVIDVLTPLGTVLLAVFLFSVALGTVMTVGEVY